MTFKGDLLTTDKTKAWNTSGARGANTSFYRGKMDRVTFEDSLLKAVDIAQMQASRISLKNTKMLSDPKLKGAYNAVYQGYFADMELLLSVENSFIEEGPTGLKYPSRVVLKNSSIK